MKKNIIFNRSLTDYKKKYKKYNKKLYCFTKKEVQEFDKKNNYTNKNYLLKGRKWCLIGDTYYEIPKAPRWIWFRNLNGFVQLSICLVLVGGIGGGIAGGIIGSSHPAGEILPTYTIEFNTRVSEQIKPVKVKKGKKLTRPKDPYKQFCSVRYWFKGEDYTVPYDFNTPVTESFTLTPVYCANETTVNVKGMNFEGISETSNFKDFAGMYKATTQVTQKCLGGFTLNETITDAEKFKTYFTDIEETDTEINANITYELYTKDGETLNIITDSDVVASRFIYVARRQNNYCGKDAKTGKNMFISSITLKSGSDEKARLHYGERLMNPPGSNNELEIMYYKTDDYHINSYRFENLDIDNFELVHATSKDNYSGSLIKNGARYGQYLTFENCNFNQSLNLQSFKQLNINNCYFYQDYEKEKKSTNHVYAKDDSAIYLSSVYNDLSCDHEINITNCVIDNFPRGIHVEDMSANKIVIKNNIIKNINQHASSFHTDCCKNVATNITYTKNGGDVYIENNKYENCNCNALKVHGQIETKGCKPNIHINNNEITSCKYVGCSQALKTSYNMDSKGNIIKDTITNMTEINDSGTTTTDESQIIFLN